MYKIIFSPKAKKEFLKLEKKNKERISNTIERLRFNPKKYVIKLVKKNAYRMRIGDYRIILDLFDDKLLILVIKIGHRKNIYKKLKRL